MILPAKVLLAWVREVFLRIDMYCGILQRNTMLHNRAGLDLAVTVGLEDVSLSALAALRPPSNARGRHEHSNLVNRSII